MKQITILTALLFVVLSSSAFGQTQSDDMAMAVLQEKMEKLGSEMEDLGKEMEAYGSEMEKYGKEMEKNPGHTPDAEKQMEELGEKMGRLGDDMGKLGDQMGQYGEKMGKKHQQMITWFFQELKKDGLLTSLNGNTRVIFDEKGLNVNETKASDALFAKYKAGLEKHWGKALKPDFLFFFKGALQEKAGRVEANGNLNTDF